MWRERGLAAARGRRWGRAVLARSRSGVGDHGAYPVVVVAQPVERRQKRRSGPVPAVTCSLARLLRDSLPRSFVRGVKHHARRMRTELIEQLGESLLFPSYMRLSLACS